MKRRSDIITAFTIALILHAVIGYSACSLFFARTGLVQPLFKTGVSSVELTFLPSLPPREERVKPEPVKQLDAEIPLMELAEEEKKETVSIEDQNADLQEKGIENGAVCDSIVRPEYPFGARIRGEEGVVVVSVMLDDSGRAVKVTITKSSGYRSLDMAAVKALKKTVFSAVGTGSLVGQTVERSFRFQLKE